MLGNTGWVKYSIWEHSRTIKDLYKRRCRLEEVEMTCSAQATELLIPHVDHGDTLLDAGCGAGYFYHSIHMRNIPLVYFGIDASPSFIEIGKKYLPGYGLSENNLQLMRIEDLDDEFDHIVSINVLTNIDNYHRPLERMLRCARKTVILRESVKENAEYLYVEDKYLDPDVRLKVHVNAYPMLELKSFIESYGFSVEFVEDRFTGGKPQMVIDYPHYWTFVVAIRKSA